jgi:transposase
MIIGAEALFQFQRKVYFCRKNIIKMKNTKKITKEITFEQVIERGCGIDVHKSLLVATIRGTGIKEETRNYGAFTEDIISLGEWLKANGVTHIAMESTGVYWRPVYNLLEEDFEILLVNASHIKNVPGHKTDKKDSCWITKLLLSGLLKGSFIPERPIRELRDFTRYKRTLIAQNASEKNRIQKILEDGNIKLSSVVSNMSGSVASKIIEELINGEEDIDKLASYRHNKMHASETDLKKSLTGNLTAHHRFMLQLIKKSIKEREMLIAELDEQIEEHLKANEMVLDRELLSTIPGVGKEGATYILAEIGNDMSTFADEHHLSSWAGMSPGNNESAGKKKSSRITQGNRNLRPILVQCGWAASRTKGTYLRSKYDSLVVRRGKKRALIAVGHKILIAAYYILKEKTPYKELGGEFLINRKKDKKVSQLFKQLKDLGVTVKEIKEEDKEVS